jgi:hypothetical protein
MSRSIVSLAFLKHILIISLLILFATSISGCGEDSFTTGDTDGTTQPGTQQGPGGTPTPGTTPPPTPTPTNVYVGVTSGTTFFNGVLDVGVSAPLSARGTTTVTGYLVDEDGNPYTVPVTFNFTSDCVQADTASIDSPVTSVNGVVEATYRAEGCVGEDTVRATASVNSNSLSASGNITIQPAAVGAIEFVSADPTTISLQGTSGIGLTESSTVTFRVVDDAGRAVAGATVNFSLSTTVGGITLDAPSGTTGDDGTVQVAVSSGAVNTSVRVVASADTGTATVTTQSVALAVSTGIPDKNSFEIVATKLRPHTWDCSGEQVTITAFASDQFNNPAPNGTAVAFQAEGGSIQGSCLLENGQCSVTWTGTDPRPSVDDPTSTDDGRATITATVIGEESYIDAGPSNGRFDDGEAYTDLPEVFYDINENGIWDANEEYFDYNENGAYDGPDGTYNGILCSPGSAQCNTTSPLLTISDDLVLVMASQEQILTAYQLRPDPNDANILTFQEITDLEPLLLPDDGSATSIRVEFADARGQLPPTGSSISVSTTTGEIVGGNTTDIADSSEAGPASFVIALRSTDANPEDGVLTVTLDMPDSNCGALTVSHPISVVIQDTTPPSIVNSSPANGDTGIALDSVLTVEFDDDMDAATFTTLPDANDPNAPTIKLTTEGGAEVTISKTSYDAVQRKLAIFPNDGANPGETLQADTQYTLSLTNNIQDDGGNGLYSGLGQTKVEISFRTTTPTP